MKIHDRRPRTARAAALLVLALSAASGMARAQLFTLSSQNCLHLGWGNPGYQANKNGILQAFFGGFNVIVLQEVMAQANVGNVTPGTHVFAVTPIQGPGTYKEAYAFLVQNTLNLTPPQITTVGGFSRPPAGVAIVTGGICTWVVDYHAVYGRSINTRRAEVGLIPQVYAQFAAAPVNGQPCPRVVIAGDWNLAANDPVFQGFINAGWNISVTPNAPTTLTRAGGPSQPYDHFLAENGVVTLVAPQVLAPPVPMNTLAWRQQVSDHLGIACAIN